MSVEKCSGNNFLYKFVSENQEENYEHFCELVISLTKKISITLQMNIFTCTWHIKEVLPTMLGQTKQISVCTTKMTIM